MSYKKIKLEGNSMPIVSLSLFKIQQTLTHQFLPSRSRNSASRSKALAIKKNKTEHEYR